MMHACLQYEYNDLITHGIMQVKEFGVITIAGWGMLNLGVNI